MFECQQDIHKKMKEKMGEKLMADEEHQMQINYYTNEVNKLKDKILKLQLEHENITLNQRLVIIFKFSAICYFSTFVFFPLEMMVNFNMICV